MASGDSDFNYYDRSKSHNSAWYKRTSGVKTTIKGELQELYRQTQPLSESSTDEEIEALVPSNDSEVNYWEEPGTVLDDIYETETVGKTANTSVNNKVVKSKKRKRKATWRPQRKAGNLSKSSKRHLHRDITCNTKLINEKLQVGSLMKSLGNPWDSVSFNDKKQFALHFYYDVLQKTGCSSQEKKKAREHAGALVGLSSKTIK